MVTNGMVIQTIGAYLKNKNNIALFQQWPCCEPISSDLAANWRTEVGYFC